MTQHHQCDLGAAGELAELAARRLFCLFWLTVIEPGAGRRPATLAPAGQLAWASAVLDGAVDL